MICHGRFSPVARLFLPPDALREPFAMKHAHPAFRLSLVLLCIVPCALCIASAAPAADPLDLKPWALECHGLRGAVAVSSNEVVAVFGASCTGARNQPKAWRVRSEDDPAYAYEKFVQPVEAKTLAHDIELEWPAGFAAPNPARQELRRHLVLLRLPTPLKPGVRYGLVAHGDGAPITGGKTGCFFVGPGADGRFVETSLPEQEGMTVCIATTCRVTSGRSCATPNA